MADKPVRIRTETGAEYVVTNVAAAKRLYPTATILQYADRTPYDGKQPSDADDETPKDDEAPASKPRRRH